MGRNICPMYELLRQMGNQSLRNTSFNVDKTYRLLLSNLKYLKKNIKSYKRLEKCLIIFQYYRNQKVFFGKL